MITKLTSKTKPEPKYPDDFISHWDGSRKDIDLSGVQESVSTTALLRYSIGVGRSKKIKTPIGR